MGTESASRRKRAEWRETTYETAYEIAQHIAWGELTTVEPREEKIGARTYRGGVKFAAPLRHLTCECGLATAPIPTVYKRHGKTTLLPTWHCTICDLAGLIQTVEKLSDYIATLAKETP